MYFIKEMIEGTDTEATLRYEFPEVRFNLNDDGKIIELQIVVVQYLRRNRKEGTNFMKRLIELAKKNKRSIALTPDASYSSETDMNQKQLIKWYEKLGFKKKLLNGFSHSINN